MDLKYLQELLRGGAMAPSDAPETESMKKNKQLIDKKPVQEEQPKQNFLDMLKQREQERAQDTSSYGGAVKEALDIASTPENFMGAGVVTKGSARQLTKMLGNKAPTYTDLIKKAAEEAINQGEHVNPRMLIDDVSDLAGFLKDMGKDVSHLTTPRGMKVLEGVDSPGYKKLLFDKSGNMAEKIEKAERLLSIQDLMKGKK